MPVSVSQLCRAKGFKDNTSEFHSCLIAMSDMSDEELVKVAAELGVTSAIAFDELDRVHLFKVGKFKGKNFTESEIREIEQNFKKFGWMVQPPLVLGHAEAEDQDILKASGLPAAGWLCEVWVDGDDVFGRFIDVPKVVKEVVAKKAFKRISVELYPDFMDETGARHGLMIRRVALLGADVPEIKTLKDVAALYQEQGELIYAFSEGVESMSTKTQAPPVQNPPAATQPPVQQPPAPPAPPASKAPQVSDADLLKKELEEERKKREALEHQFAEEKKKREELSTELAKQKLEKDRAMIASFCEDLKRQGRFLPAWEEKGIVRFMEALSETQVMKFSDAADAKEESSRAWFQRFLSELPEIVKFKEIAEGGQPKRSEPGTVNDALNAAAEKIYNEKKKAGAAVSFAECVKEAARLNPRLVESV